MPLSPTRLLSPLTFLIKSKYFLLRLLLKGLKVMPYLPAPLPPESLESSQFLTFSTTKIFQRALVASQRPASEEALGKAFLSPGHKRIEGLIYSTQEVAMEL